jgi:hypothetical protein
VQRQERTPPALLVTAGHESMWPFLGPRSEHQRRGTTSASHDCRVAGDGPARQGAARVRSNLARCLFFLSTFIHFYRSVKLLLEINPKQIIKCVNYFGSIFMHVPETFTQHSKPVVCQNSFYIIYGI